MQKLINEDMKVLEAMGEEVLNDSMNFNIADFNDLRDKLKNACDDHYESDLKYHNILRELIAETAKRIDDKVSP